MPASSVSSGAPAASESGAMEVDGGGGADDEEKATRSSLCLIPFQHRLAPAPGVHQHLFFGDADASFWRLAAFGPNPYITHRDTFI